jgi:hypothetical protein
MQTPAAGPKSDLFALLVLSVIAIALRGWQLTHTEVASRDSVGYIRIAWQLEHRNWSEVLPHAQQHPGYPLVLLAISWPVRQFIHADLATQMQYSAQFASALASVLLVVPMYYLGRELFNRRVGLWTALFFQCLPSSGREMADGLSEPLFLLAAASALAFACNALRTGRALSFAWCGLFGALAYLVRPEGALLVAATGLVLLALQLLPRRLPWRRALLGGALLTATAGVVAGPYMYTIGGITNKPTGRRVMGEEVTSLGPGGGKSAAAPAVGPLFAVWFTDHEHGGTSRSWWDVVTLLEVLHKGFFYVFWGPALLGLWLFRNRFRIVPGTWVLVLVSVALGMLLFRVAHIMGYLSDRHTLLIVLTGSYFAVAAILAIGDCLAAVAMYLRPKLAGKGWVRGPLWGAVLLAAAVVGPLPRTLERLHADRSGFRAAGRWLAQNTQPGDFVLDPYCWANYYAGRVFTEGTPHLPAQQPPVHYLVFEQSPNKHTRLPEHLAAEFMVKHGIGHEVQRFDVKRGTDRAAVVIYEIPGAWNPEKWPQPGVGGLTAAAPHW